MELVAPGAHSIVTLTRWFARHLAPKSAAALRHAAAAARDACSSPSARAALPELERLYLDDLMRTHDAVEGIDAFLEKRPPIWKDR